MTTRQRPELLDASADQLTRLRRLIGSIPGGALVSSGPADMTLTSLLDALEASLSANRRLVDGLVADQDKLHQLQADVQAVQRLFGGQS